ncbi:long-chain-fatty-acid--CoA ligase [Mycolicibacterium chitae]|uniref:Long-chain-fatty-acid--CoA ligase FadD13 n=1 Tax=Mycolicibacterium chitae TaxID=1792 RepID=A0A448IDK3_MYCCI|nr:AMP-binding protein [Mycolicibacterium chitae]MCV7105340.1 AMP-binding protein [Mycolicibacterium chitae]BBZ01693.1 long-chain-fatty-acid--CoA ligase [Mycolicibacterium chitae]VEG50529.1 AMP-dependent synthetase and ligase [Mycolicibacterium chitae]
MLTATVADEIRAAARQYPRTPVQIHSAVNPDRTTLGELFDESRRMAAGLTDLGVRPGDVVALQLPNWRQCFVAHAATWLCGAVVLPIVPIYGPAEVAFIVRQSGARALILARELRNRDAGATLSAVAEAGGVDLRILVGDPLPGTVSYAELTDVAPIGSDPVPVDPADRCLLVYTSGTTAQPKGVQHTHASLLGEIRSMDEIRAAGPELTTLSLFPSGHIAGTLGILRMFCRANTTLAMDAWNPELAARLIDQHGVAASGGAPIHLGGILDVAERDGLDLSSLREFTTGAAGVAGALIRRADKHGAGAFRCYGSSEHPTVSSGRPEDALDKRADTDGRITPGTEVRIVDDVGRDVESGCAGEILTRGPDQFVGYTGGEHTAAAMVDGWFRTGDVGRLDAEGYLTITDRKKDIIVRGGENISSKEVEDVLSSHPAIAEAAAVGAADATYGERVCAFVVVNAGQRFGLVEAAQHFTECGLARQKTPERIVVVDELPRTASGKVQKHLLRAQLQASNQPTNAK